MPLVVCDEDVAGQGKDTQSIEGQGGAISAKRSLTGTTSKEAGSNLDLSK